jgi:hypothetical protein
VGLTPQGKGVLHHALGFRLPFNAHLWVRNFDRVELCIPQGDRDRPKEGTAFRSLPCWEDSWIHYHPAYS